MQITRVNQPKRELRAAPLLLGALLVGASSASAQSIQVLMIEGDVIPGAPGTMSRVSDLYVGNDGQWIASTVQTISGGSSNAMILNGAAVLLEDDPLVDPAGESVLSFDDVALDDNGVIWWNISSSAPSSENEVMYRNLVRTAGEGDLFNDPKLPSGTEWRDFDGFTLGQPGQLLILGDIDIIGKTGTEPALVLQTFDEQGVLISEETLLTEDDPLDGVNDEVGDVGTSTAAHDVAVSGDHWIAYVKSDGSSGGDELVILDGAVIAQENGANFATGTFFGRLKSNAVDINVHGDYVFRGESAETFGGTDFDTIFLNNFPYRMEGEMVDDIAPFTFDAFGSLSPIHLANNGNIMYYVKTTNSNPAIDEGYMLNERMIVQDGVTQIGLQSVSLLSKSGNGFHMSKNGRYVMFEAQLGSGDEGLFLMDMGLIQEMSSATTNLATLKQTAGFAILGDSVTFEMDGEQDVGVTPFLLLSNAPVAGWSNSGVGLITPFGELLVDITPSAGNPGLVLVGQPSDLSPVELTVDIPVNTALLNQNFYAQGIYFDIGDQSPAESLRLTNGLEITVATN